MPRIGPAVALLAALALAPATLRGQPAWSEPQVLDTRLALEFAQPRQDEHDQVVYLPILFQNPLDTTIEIGIVDTSVDPPSFAKHVTASGSLFALGAAGRVGDRVGFSYIDGFFDGRFGTCADPCFPSNHLVSGGTYIDSASAVSADDFFVALLDNAANNAILTRYSTNGGSTWQTLHTTLPPEPGGVYQNFQGGKRIQLLVDREATDPATTRNCLLYEVIPASPGNTTELHLRCRNGASAALGGGAFDAVLDTDVKNAENEYDKYIENGCILVATGGGSDVVCAYSHRATEETRLVRVNESGQVSGPTTLRPAPTGSELYNLGLFGPGGGDEIHVVHPLGFDLPVAETAADFQAGVWRRPGESPETYSPALAIQLIADDEVSAFLYMFFNWNLVPPGAAASETGAGDGVVALSRRRMPLFEDYFETGNALRWSSSTPP